MNRVQPVTKENAQGSVKELYSTIEKKMGKLPNIFLNMGNSAAVIKGYLGLNDALDQTSLSPKLREQIALIVGQTNQCNYCISAHSVIAHSSGIADQEIILARKGQSDDPKTQSILSFAKAVVEKRGKISDQEVADLKAVGITDKEIVEIILAISLNMFTNYFNHITDTKIDFPLAPKLS